MSVGFEIIQVYHPDKVPPRQGAIGESGATVTELCERRGLEGRQQLNIETFFYIIDVASMTACRNSGTHRDIFDAVDLHT